MKPPQLDEFFLAGEEHLRRDELRRARPADTLMKPRSSFAGAAIEVSDLARSIAFHRLWLPMLGFRRVWASPDRVMWSRGYDHFVMRQAKDGVSYGPGALWLAVSAESRAQVDQVYAELRDAEAEILQPPKELDYFAPGYYSVGFRDPDGVPIEVVHRWDELPELADAEQVHVPGHGVTLGGYFFKPQAGVPPYPALILLHGFAGHAHNMAGLARAASANGYAALALSLRGWLGSEGESDQGLRQPLDVLAAIDWLAKRPLVDRDRLALVGASMGGQVALLAAAHKPPIKAVASFFAADRSGALARGQSVHARLSRRSLRAGGPAGALADPAGGADRRAGAADPRRPRRERAGRPDPGHGRGAQGPRQGGRNLHRAGRHAFLHRAAERAGAA